jgi:hypothetical protein
MTLCEAAQQGTVKQHTRQIRVLPPKSLLGPLSCLFIDIYSHGEGQKSNGSKDEKLVARLLEGQPWVLESRHFLCCDL